MRKDMLDTVKLERLLSGDNEKKITDPASYTQDKFGALDGSGSVKDRPWRGKKCWFPTRAP
jgi:hypothetical protein